MISTRRSVALLTMTTVVVLGSVGALASAEVDGASRSNWYRILLEQGETHGYEWRNPAAPRADRDATSALEAI